MSKQDYYETLGVAKSASQAEIKKAYRKMAMQHHPDRTKGDKASEEKFKAATEAYEILSDESKRQAYDQFGHAGVDPSSMGGGAGAGGFGDIFGDIFSDIFSGAAGGRSQRGQSRGRDLQYRVDLTLEEAVFGKSLEISVPTWVHCKPCSGSGAKKGSKPVTCSTCHGQGQVRMQQGFFAIQQTCPNCHGKGQMIGSPCTSCNGQGRVRDTKRLNVKIPKGVDTGDRIRLSGEGEAAANGGISGDLYVEVHVKPHEIFKRNGADLHIEMPVDMTTAALGGELEVPTMTGKIKLKIPAETQTGKIFKLRGKGVTTVRHSYQGDLLCKIIVETPVGLTKEQRELMEQLRDSMNNHHHSPKVSRWLQSVKNFFEKM